LVDSLDERYSVQDQNLWFSEYEKRRSLSISNYLNIARYRMGRQIGDLGFAYTALKKALSMDPGSVEAHAMLARANREMGLADEGAEYERREYLRGLAESDPDDVNAAFAYVMALVSNYRREFSVANHPEMDDAVEWMKRCIQLTGGREERFHIILASILSGAWRYEEAADALKSLLELRHSGITGSDLLPEAVLFGNIGEDYYNAGRLAEAERYFKLSQSMNPHNSKVPAMLRKIGLKKRGLK
jgi:tetratricopeptide (TPR) repeat protein